MQAQYYDKVYEVPDELGTDPAAIRAWIEKNAMSAPVQEPSFFQRVGGHLERGVANTAEAVANAFGTVGGKGVEKFYKERAAAIREAPLAKAVAEHPETSALGQIGAGLVEFIPELLAMQMTVGPVLGAAGSIPRVGKYVQALSPVKGEAFFPDTFRAITRGAVEGGLWGTTTAKSDSTIGERLAHGAEEAEAFAVGIGILHPTFFGLRKAVGMALGKAASRVRSDADVRAALESGKLSKENEARAKELLERQEQALQQQEADAIRGLGGSPADLERAARIEGEQAVGEMFGARQRTRPYEEQMPPSYDSVPRPSEPPPPPAPAAGGFPEGAKAGGSGQAGEPTRLDQSLVQEGTVVSRERIPESEDTSPFANQMRASIRKLLDDYHEKPRDIGEGSNPANGNPTSDIRLSSGAGKERVSESPFITLKNGKTTESGVERTVFAPKYVIEVYDKVTKKWEVVEEAFSDADAVEAYHRYKSFIRPPEPKRLSIKFVSEELGRRLSGLGATRAEVKAIVDQVTSKPMTDLAVRRELMLREFSSEDVAALKPEARREELNKLLVEERLDAEIEKRAPSTRVEDKGLSVTPELDVAIRFEQQVRKVAEAEGIPLEKVAERTPEEIKDAYKRIMNGEVVEPAVKQAAPIIGKTDARGLELVDKVLDAAKDHPEYTPEELQLIREDLARFRDALIDQEQSRAATGEDVARKRRRLEPEQPVVKEKTPEQLAEEREIQEWLDSEATPTEIAEKIAETGKPAPKVVETAEDWNKLLADEGMPDELPGTIMDFAGLQKMYEMIRDNLMKATDPKELAMLGRGLMLEGSRDFDKFKSRMKDIAGPNWGAIQGHIGSVYKDSKAWIDHLEANGVLSYHGTKLSFMPIKEYKHPAESGVTVDFMGLQNAYEAFLGVARDFRKDSKSIVARELGEQMLGKNGKEWLVDRRPAFDKVRIWEIQVRDPKRVGLKIGGSGEKLVFDLNEAELRYQYEVKGPDGHYSLFKAIASKLSEAQQIELTKVLDGKAKPTSVGVAEAAATLKDWFKIMWDKRIKAQLADFESHLKPEENEALLSVINKGIDPGIAFAKFEPKDQKVLKSLLDDYRDLQKRKIENYRPHVERGDILLQVQTDKGKFKTVAVALNSKDAVRKALALREVDPSIELFLDTNFAKDLPQGISKGQYWSVASRLSKANAELLKDINGEIGKGEAGAAARRAMRGIFVIKPTQKFSEFELRRMGILKGEENVFDTIFSYAYKTEKKLALDPVIAQARKVINDDYAGQPNTQHFLRELVEDVKGTYSWQDKAADDLVRWLGFEGQSMTATKAAANIRMVEGYLKLGWRPVSALFNYLGGQSNVWAKFGQQYFREGYEFLKTPEGKKFIKEMEPVMGQTFAHEGEQLTIRTGKQLGIDWTKLPPALRWFQPMALFEAPEIPNRSIGLAAPYMYALKELKLPEAAARNFAMRQNWFSQATYNMASMPKLMRSPLGRIAGQFKTYMVNQIEFMATLRGPEAFRYIAAQIALGGPRGAVSFLKSVPFLAMMPWWDEMEDWMNKEYPNFSRGVVGGMLGMDVTGPSTLQFPTSVTDWLGPFVNDVIKVHRNVVSPYLEGAKPMPKTPGEAAEIPFSALEQVSPVIRYWPKLLIDRIAHPSQDSYIIKDQRGREIYRLEPFDLVKEVMGGTPTEAARLTQFQANERRRQKVENLRKGHVVDAVMEAMAEGNEIPDGYIEELIALGIKPASLRREAKLRSLPPEIRMMLQTQLSKRADLLERHPYQGD